MKTRLINTLSKLEVDEGIDVKYIYTDGNNLTCGFRRIYIADMNVIMVGGYGFDFKVYNLDYHFEKERTVYEKIVEDFMNNIQTICSIENPETF